MKLDSRKIKFSQKGYSLAQSRSQNVKKSFYFVQLHAKLHTVSSL